MDIDALAPCVSRYQQHLLHKHWVSTVPAERKEVLTTPVRPLEMMAGKIVPYVLVTGLIPLAKQLKEYHQKFDNASFKNATIDAPNWSSYRIERTEVQPGVAEKWSTIDVKAAIAVMMQGFVSAKLTEAEAAVLNSQYVDAMHGLPIWAIVRACNRFRDGTVRPEELGVKSLDHAQTFFQASDPFMG
jgi:hypothetical protein